MNVRYLSITAALSVVMTLTVWWHYGWPRPSWGVALRPDGRALDHLQVQPPATQRTVAGGAVAELRRLREEGVELSGVPQSIEVALRRGARQDPAEMCACLAMLPEGTLRAELTATVMSHWGRVDLPAALDWAKRCEDPALRQTALLHLSYRWFETNPVEALAYAVLNPRENLQLLTNLVGLWAQEQPDAAAIWAAEYSSEPALRDVVANAVAIWAQRDDMAAAEFVLRLPTGPLRREAAIAVMSALARSDPFFGATWTDAFPPGPEKHYAIEILAYTWAVTDLGAALAWIDRLPSVERDTALFGGAGGLIDSHPETAAEWAMAIDDQARRLRQSERIARSWLTRDRVAAESWILRSALPESMKLRLLASEAARL